MSVKKMYFLLLVYKKEDHVLLSILLPLEASQNKAPRQL
jgi:hypothetical protein